MDPATLLPSLRDVEGVVGSFLFDDTGALVAQDLPAYVGAGTLEEVTPRLLRLASSVPGDAEPEGLSLRFTDHLLSLRPLPGGHLGVLSLATVSAPALRMAVNLTAKQLARVPLVPRVPSAPTTAAPTTVEPSERTSAPPGAKSLRRYRGVVIEE